MIRVAIWRLKSLATFQLKSNPFPKPPYRSLGATKLLADVARRMAEQTELDDRPFILLQAGKQMIDCFTHFQCLLGRRLPAYRLEPRRSAAGIAGRGQLPRYIPPLCMVIGDSFSTLANSDNGQKPPKAIPVHDLQIRGIIAQEKTLVR